MLLNFTKKWKSFFFSGELYRFVFGMILRFSLKKAVGKTIAFHRIRKRCRCLCYQAYNFLLYYKIATFTIDSNTNNWSHVNHGNLRIDKSFSNAVYIIYRFFHRKTFTLSKKTWSDCSYRISFRTLFTKLIIHEAVESGYCQTQRAIGKAYCKCYWPLKCHLIFSYPFTIFCVSIAWRTNVHFLWFCLTLYPLESDKQFIFLSDNITSQQFL